MSIKLEVLFVAHIICRINSKDILPDIDLNIALSQRKMHADMSVRRRSQLLPKMPMY